MRFPSSYFECYLVLTDVYRLNQTSTADDKKVKLISVDLLHVELTSVRRDTFLPSGCFSSGVVAEDAVVTHYRVKNSSLCLHVTKPPPNISGSWTFVKTSIVSHQNINPNYKGKVDFYPLNLTLCIRGLTDKDTGVYKVTFPDSKFEEVTETHNVIVQDPVPRPVVVTSVLSNNRSAGLCSITVNCSVRADWAWSVCDGDGCAPSRRSFGEVNITISGDNGTVVCSGSNHVSANNVSESTATMCFNESDPEHREASQTIFAIALLFAVCLCLCAFIAFLAKRLFSECNHHQGQTPTARLIQSQPIEEPPRPERRVSTSSSSPTEAAYENVDAARQEVDTVYSVLQAVASVTPSPGNSEGDVKGHEALGEAASSQCAAVDEASQVCTVYSVLRKPKRPEATVPPTGQRR